MSASNPNQSREGIPVQNYLSFNGKTGKFGNKIGEQDIQDVPLPMRFILLDGSAFMAENSTMNGTVRKVKSNIGHYTYQRTLTVKYDDLRADEQPLYVGEWTGTTKDNPNIKANGVRFVNVFYLCGIGADNKPCLDRLKLKGKASWAFSDFRKKTVSAAKAALAAENAKALAANQPTKEDTITEYDFVYTVTGTEITPSLKGDPSPVPVFKAEPISEKAKAVQLEQDFILQGLLVKYYDFQHEETQAVTEPAPPAAQPAPVQQAAPAPPVQQPAPPPAAPPVQQAPPPPPVDTDLPF